MADGSRSPRAWPKTRHLAVGGGGVAVFVLLLVLVLMFRPPSPAYPAGPGPYGPGSYGPGSYGPGPGLAPASYGPACPRPNPIPSPPGLGGQESEIRQLRRRAFAGDFFAQIELAHRYDGKRSVDQNLVNPIEAATWYAMALSNPDGWSGVDRQNVPPPVVSDFDVFMNRVSFGMWPVPTYDFPPSSCRDAERTEAYARLNDLSSNLTGPDREAVRDRVIYLLSSQGSHGYLTLARMYDQGYATFGEPWSDPVATRVNVNNISAIFVRSDADAWLYNYLAASTGDIGGYVALNQFEQTHPDKADALVAAANRWTPPFEFYPPEPPENKPGALQYSDETRPADGADEYALREFEAVPFTHVARALCFLQVAHCPIESAKVLDPHVVGAFHAMIGEPVKDPFTLLDGVRAIQLAAIRGSADAQLLLAVMYAEGIGVRGDYARSLKWFEAAAHQGSPAAQYAVSEYFALGAEGIADQDKAAAVAARLASAVDGFHPSAQRLRDLLAHICRTHHAEKFDKGSRNG